MGLFDLKEFDNTRVDLLSKLISIKLLLFLRLRGGDTTVILRCLGFTPPILVTSGILELFYHHIIIVKFFVLNLIFRIKFRIKFRTKFRIKFRFKFRIEFRIKFYISY